MDESNPTARALLCLQLLQESPGITAERLGVKLGVSPRAARRYVSTLREAGIPVESLRGPYGGYRLGRGLRLPPLVFSANEALALVMAVLDGHHHASDPTDPAASALGKIVRALPESVAAHAERVRRAASPAPDRSAARPDLETTATLVEACSSHRLVRVAYRSEAGSEWVTDVEPWAVVVRHGRWYLLCRSLSADAVRAYRVDRVREVSLLDQHFQEPADLDPVATLEEHLAVGWEYDVEVVIDAPADTLRNWLPRTLGRIVVSDDSSCRLVGSTSNPTWYAEQLAVIAAPFRVVRGLEVQEAVRVLARRLLEAGGDSAAREAGGA